MAEGLDERNDAREKNTVVADHLWLLILVVLGSVLGFGCLFAMGPTVIADTLFYWRKRRDLRKELVSSSRPIAIHVVNRRQSNGNFFVTLGYQMDGTSYASENEKTSEEIYTLPDDDGTPKLIVFKRTSLQWKDGCFSGRVSSRYPASGPFYSPALFSPGDDDSFCAAACRFPVFVLVTAFMTFALGTIVGARTNVGYCVTAVFLLLIGVLAAVNLHVLWRNATLNAYHIVDDLPARAMDDDKELVGDLETGVPVVKVDDDAATEVTEELSDDNTADNGII